MKYLNGRQENFQTAPRFHNPAVPIIKNCIKFQDNRLKMTLELHYKRQKILRILENESLKRQLIKGVKNVV